MADRRSFLCGLASLPLIGGSIAFVTDPGSQARHGGALKPQLLESYRCWLLNEHWALAEELAEGDAYAMDVLVNDQLRHLPGGRFHLSGVPKASARAAVILSAAGVPLTGGRDNG